MARIRVTKRGYRPPVDFSFGLSLAIVAVTIGLLAVVVAMAGWFVWGLIDLAGGNPATAWNVGGVLFGSITLGAFVAGVAR